MITSTLRQRLCDQLNQDRDAELRVLTDDFIEVSSFRGLSLRPLKWELTEDELAALVDSVDSEDLEEVWPGRTDEWKAFALLATRLESLLATADGPVNKVKLVNGVLVVA